MHNMVAHPGNETNHESKTWKKKVAFQDETEGIPFLVLAGEEPSKKIPKDKSTKEGTTGTQTIVE